MSPALLIVAALGAAPASELLDFSATWCGPCQQAKPFIQQLRRQGLPVREVDVDRQRDLAQRFSITAMPTFVLVVEGKEVDRVVGYKPGVTEPELRRLLAKIPPAKTEPTSKTVEAEPDKKPWFTPPWSRKSEPPAAEPPKFEEPAVVRGQPVDVAAPAKAAAPSAAQDPLQTVVRIRVTDERGTDYGSGTVIGSLEGKALVLTCWHIFRAFGESAKVEVDLFPEGPNGPVKTFPGRLIQGEQEADVAVIGVAGCGKLPVSPIAGSDHAPKEGDHVFSVGCGEGKQPTKLQHSVTRLDPYQGPHTTECTGVPVVGRSGGGLFDTKGRVVGVCFAANHAEEKGVYVGLAEIHKLLDTAGYAALVPDEQPAQVAAGVPSSSGPAADNVFDNLGAAATVPEVAVVNPSAPKQTSGATPARPAAVSSDLLGEMEATIILKPRNQPNGATQVIVINNVSNRFRRYLTGELDRRPVETGLRVPVSEAADRVQPKARVALLCRVFDNHGPSAAARELRH
jgi:thiol-disulfide isomerase/thioredoxin